MSSMYRIQCGLFFLVSANDLIWLGSDWQNTEWTDFQLAALWHESLLLSL